MTGKKVSFEAVSIRRQTVPEVATSHRKRTCRECEDVKKKWKIWAKLTACHIWRASNHQLLLLPPPLQLLQLLKE